MVELAMQGDTHIFALYQTNFWSDDATTSRSMVTKRITDADSVHRLVKVLRSNVGDQYVFFDRQFHGVVQIKEISKKDIVVQVLSSSANNAAGSEVTFLLPLLKKEALEQAVYSLSEIGVYKIQLVVTQKSRQSLLHAKEFERLQAIVISAAEQSKNYVFPELLPPVRLGDVVESALQSYAIVFDGAGKSFFDLKPQINHSGSITALVGPEGGLSASELDMVLQSSFHACRLTSTTLRAVQAVAVGAGMLKLT